MTIVWLWVAGAAAAMAAALAAPPADAPAKEVPAPAPGWQLAWADEFDGSAIDSEKWTLADDCWGGGNAERQCYTTSAANAGISAGELHITARAQRHRGPALPAEQRSSADRPGKVTRGFTSARLSTRGKAAWRHGLIEVRARLPQGQGLWPAIWMLPEQDRYGQWAASGEIDIMEAVNLGEPCATGSPGCVTGRERGVLGTLHFGGTFPANRQRGAATAMPQPFDGFHVYSVEWQPDAITWRIDGVVYARQQPGDWSTSGSGSGSASPSAPFDQPFHLVINLAVGGHLPEQRNRGGVTSQGFPKVMAVDWVRVWQCAGEAATTAPCPPLRN